jgi:hypothetical protein
MPVAGFEPLILGLRAKCSTTVLPLPGHNPVHSFEDTWLHFLSFLVKYFKFVLTKMIFIALLQVTQLTDYFKLVEYHQLALCLPFIVNYF